MADSALIAPGEDERNALIPLPRNVPASDWQELADSVSAHYLANRPNTFPDCGRRGLLADPTALAHLFAAIDTGLTPQQAGNSIGMNPATVTAWLARAEKEPSSAFAVFSAACQMAKDRRRSRLLQTIENASLRGPQFWTAAAWTAERTFGNDYKLNQDKQQASVVVNVGIIGASDIKIGGESGAHNVLPDVVIPVSD
jgi:hypothetical protein